MKDLSLQERFIELRAQGLSYDKIAKKLEVSKQTTINWSKKLHVDVENLRQLNLETMIERLKLDAKNRLETYSEILKKARAELEKRNFDDVSTDKLVSIIEKVNEKIESLESIVFSEKTGLFEFDDFKQTSWNG